MTRPLIAYCRVSTSKQGRSGLGLEAQQEALSRFAEAEGFDLVRTFVEIETIKIALPPHSLQRSGLIYF